MTARQKRIVLVLTIAIALTRLAATARSLWDWDEALFTTAVRDYDVARHHPHPPGYPLFIAAAKAVHALGVDEFRALQTVTLLGAMAIFPALFFLAMELGFTFAASAAGAALFAFLPNVWTYGGTGFSDVPGTALGFVACALLLRGRRDPRAYLLGAIVLGIAAGFRPTNLLVGLVPAVLATRARKPREIATAFVAGMIVVVASYGGAALASQSVDAYREALRGQQEWVRNVDSWRSPHRPPLLDAAKLFFVTPVRHDDTMIPFTVLAALSLVMAMVRRNAAVLLTLATFLPIALFSWLELDFQSAGRYAIAYLAVHALLVAAIRPWLAAIVAALFVVWTWPALVEQRATDSPPVAALRSVPPHARVAVHGSIRPHAEVVLEGRAFTVFVDAPPAADVVVRSTLAPNATEFRRERKRLWNVVRRRYFEASVTR